MPVKVYVQHGYVENFLSIVIGSHREFLARRSSLERWDASGRLTGDDFLAAYDYCLEQAFSTVIFAIALAEAYINEYAARRISRSYAENYLDKLDLRSKWVVIPRIISGEGLPTDGAAFRLLKSHISVRNELMHHKPMKEVDSSELLSVRDKRDEKVIDAARNSILLLCELAEAMKQIDPDEDSYFVDFLTKWGRKVHGEHIKEAAQADGDL